MTTEIPVRKFRPAPVGASSSLMRRPSAAAALLDVAGMRALLRKLDFMQRITRGERVLAEDWHDKIYCFMHN